MPKLPMTEIAKNLQIVRHQILESTKRRSEGIINPVRLVAVTKTKPIDLIKEAYSYGQEHFGENYTNELIEKASNPSIQIECPNIKWHYIGHLQSNKVNKIVSIPNLYMIETIDSVKIADAINKSFASFYKEETNKQLNVMVQINTSEEEQKHGIDIKSAHGLVVHILNNCSFLKLLGLMTIGSFDHDLTKGPNPDFLRLVDIRKTITNKLGINEYDFELSMGMSNDYQHAIENGSSNVRIGSTIFGARNVINK